MKQKLPPPKSNLQKRLYEIIKREERLLKLQEQEFDMRQKSARKWQVNYMWISLIIGFGVIMLNTFLIEKEFMSGEPQLSVVVLDLIGIMIAINLIYSSYKTKKEILMDKQKEILNELEK